MKLLSRLLALVLTVVCALLLTAVYLLMSPQGLDWAYRFATVLAPGNLTIEQREGQLRGPIRLRGIHYHNDQLDVRMAELDLQWRPGDLVVGRLHIEDLAVTGLHVLHMSPAAPTATTAFPNVGLPISLQIDHAELHDFHFTGSADDPGFTINDAALHNAAFHGNVLNVQQLIVNAQHFHVNVSGKLTPQHDYPMDLTVQWSADGGDYGMFAGKGRFRGDLDKIDVRHQLTSPLHADLRGAITDPLHNLGWQGELSWPAVNLHALRSTFPVLSLGGKVHGSGDLKHVEAEGELRSAYQDLHADHRFVVDYDIEKGLINIRHLNNNLLETGGTLIVHGTIANLYETPNAELAGAWHHLRWPLRGKTMAQSQAGTFAVTGDMDDYHFTLAGDVSGEQIPGATVSVEASGHTQGLTLSQVKAHLLDGDVSVSGKVAWQPALSWQLNVQGEGLNPGKQWREWPGHIELAAQLDGGMKNDRLLTHLTLNRLHGDLKSIPFDASAALNVRGDQLRLEGLRIDSGKNRLTASGTLQDEWNLAWEVSAADLAHLVPGSEGRLQGSGYITGARLRPSVTASLAGQQLRFAADRIGALSAVLAVDTQGRIPSTAEIEINDADFEDRHMDSIRIRGDGTAQHHQAQLAIDSPFGNLMLAFSGKYIDQAWRGELERLDVDTSTAGHWQLNTATPFAVDKSGAQLHEFCLQQDHAHVCATANGKAVNDWRLSARAHDLPLSLAEAWLPTGSSLNGKLDANAHFDMSPTVALNGEVKLILQAGVVSPATLGATPTTHIAYHGGEFEVMLDDHALRANARVDLADGGSLQGGLRIERTALPVPLGGGMGSVANTVTGRLQGDIRDLSLLPAFVPGIEHTKGRLFSTFNIAGSWEHPRIVGELRLEDGSAVIPALGLNPDSIDIVVRGDEQGHLRLDAQLHSKDGILRLGGDIQYSRPAGWNIEAQLNGERVEIVNTPEYHILASPTMHLSVKGHRIDVSGELLIPEANLRPRDESGAVSPSSDVVIVNAEGPAPMQERWQIYTNIRVRLGNFVKFNGFGLKGLLNGDFTLNDEPQKPTVARGELSIADGQYHAYGQKLTVERGRLLFFGGPVDNPGLDIRAVRKIQDVTAGIMVRGTLKAPQAQLFSEPAMAEADALSYLLLGRPINQASGTEGQQMYGAALSLGLAGSGLLSSQVAQRFGIDEVTVESGGNFGTGAVVIRHYLSPKLYISYGVGLLERINVFLMRYQISRRWALEGESGTQSGADLVYTLERE